MYHVLYNPMSAGNSGTKKIQVLEGKLTDGGVLREDITQIADLYSYMQGVSKEDKVVIAGGDGTLNHLADQMDGRLPPRALYYYPIGSGNDFAADIGEKPENRLIPMESYLRDLPTVEIGGRPRRFLNCAGNGFDGYCCGEGARLRKLSDKPVNYTAIALKGLLRTYSPSRAKITVDGVAHTYDKVWLAPTMNGRFFGGGMMICPGQDRMAPDKQLSVVVVHDCTRVQMLSVFPSIFKGAHMKFKSIVERLTGHEILVEYEKPSVMQIDGEVVEGERFCRCVSGAKAEKSR